MKSVGQNNPTKKRYPLRVEKVPQISQIYTDFSWDVFFVTQISQMTQIFFHRMTRNFAEATCSVVADIPLGLDKAIHQRFHKKSVYICEICGTKIIPRRKICVICEICVTKNNSSTYRARAIGQRPNIRANP